MPRSPEGFRVLKSLYQLEESAMERAQKYLENTLPYELLPGEPGYNPNISKKQRNKVNKFRRRIERFF
jgi:hypothetical protein